MNWYKISFKTIQISPAEINWAEWALDPMYDMWCTEEGSYERDGNIYNENQLPKIENGIFILSEIYEINEDLLYRLEEQAPEVSECDAISNQQIKARCRAALTLSQKIRELL
jgi:hypothetical protein